jgi:ferrous iron transport protein B
VPEQVISQELAHQKLTEYQTEARKIAVEVDQSIDPKILSLTRKIDGVVLHPIFGGAIFFGIFYLVFHAIYTWSSPLMDAMEALVGSLGELLAGVVHVEWMKSLLVDGILGGVGGVVVFLPQIVILFFLISLMEQSGYISRAAFITDRSMSWFGLSGRAFLPFLSGFACAIPSIMAARNIANKKERMATMMVLPFITCSARLPVFILLIGTFIPARTVYGIFQTQALALFFLYFLGSIIALVSAKLLRLSLFKGKSDSFIMDLPIYQRPKISWAWKHAWGKGKTFLTKAGTTILMLSMVLWLLSTFPKPAEELLAGKTENQIKSLELENSAIGRLGKLIEPAIAPLGYDWKMGVGILVAFGARELFVSTLGTLYALADANEESESLRTMLATETKADGTPTYSLAVVWSLLIFFVIALQCISTYATMKRETGGHKWPLIQLIAMTCLAYLGSWLTYSLLN